jgi:hypothetical protein
MLDSILVTPRTRTGRYEPPPTAVTRRACTTARFGWTVAELWKIPELPGSYTVYGYTPREEDVFGADSADLRESLLNHFRDRDLWFVPAFVEVSYVPKARPRRTRAIVAAPRPRRRLPR